MSNTHPNTPFGHFFEKIGVWKKPTAPDTIKAILEKIKTLEASSVVEIQASIALLKANLNNIPQSVFEVFKLTKEEVAAFLEAIEQDILLAAAKVKI